MGRDGLEGIRAIKKSGGVAVVQDPTTAVVGSMPMAIIKNDLANRVLTPPEIASMIKERYQ